jgi:hypothetical protein
MVSEVRGLRMVLLIAIVLPWVVWLLYRPFVGWHWPDVLTVRLVVDAALAAFAWRRPTGIAANLVFVRVSVSALFTLAYSRSGWGTAMAIIDASLAVLLVVQFVQMYRWGGWGPLAQERREAQERHTDERYAKADRRASETRYARLERRGQL